MSPRSATRFPVYLIGVVHVFHGAKNRVAAFPQLSVPDSPTCIGFLCVDASAIWDAFSPSRRRRRRRRREFSPPGRNPADVNLGDNGARAVCGGIIHGGCEDAKATCGGCALPENRSSLPRPGPRTRSSNAAAPSPIEEDFVAAAAVVFLSPVPQLSVDGGGGRSAKETAVTFV